MYFLYSSVDHWQEYLSDSEKVDLDTFLDRIWSTIKDIYKPPPEAADADMEAKGERESEDLSGSTASPPESVSVYITIKLCFRFLLLHQYL